MSDYDNGYDMLYEAFRHYPSRPESAIVKDFMTYVSIVITITSTQTVTE